MLLVLSVEVEAFLDDLESSDQVSLDLVRDDLRLLDLLGFDSISLGSMIGRWVYLTGPTGRVAYWMTPMDDDRWLIESIDVS